MTARYSLVALIVLVLVPLPAGSNDSPVNTDEIRRPTGRVGYDPYDLVSEETMLPFLEGLTSIRPFAGWRNSASAGESEAIDYVADQLFRMSNLVAWGLEIERQPFHTFSGTDFRETRVHVEIDGVETEIPAFGVSGHRDELDAALLFDSDGGANDSQPDPVVVSGPPTVIGWEDDVFSLPSLQGRVVLLDYAVIDRVTLGLDIAQAHAEEILDREPAAIVPITSFSNVNGQSHGVFSGDLPVWVAFRRPLPPILNIRLEDLSSQGLDSWAELEIIDSVRVTWDMDVQSPGTSHNLVARIPGEDNSRAVILGAHIDSPNTPGALDDGSGSVSLLQVAAAIDGARCRPPVDLYLVWFGSEERGLYGSSVFVARQQELLDRTLAMLQIDCLTVPLQGSDHYLNLSTWTFGLFGDDRATFPVYLSQQASDLGVYTVPYGAYSAGSDHINFNAWNVPNAKLGSSNPDDPTQFHYAGHIHDPYDEVWLLRQEIHGLVDMATLALAAALRTGRDDPGLRVTPEADRRAVFVASHTESTHMTPTHLIHFSMALAWDGFDVDMVPFGREVVPEDLVDADLVVVLPVHDWPSGDAAAGSYDEAWTDGEVDALETYARGGGLLVLANSVHRMKTFNRTYEMNEDATDLNLLAGRFSVNFELGSLTGNRAVVTGSHPLVDGVTSLVTATDNAVPYTFSGGQTLARINGQPVVYIRPAGNGEVLVLGDLGILGDGDDEVSNLGFWYNLIDYVRTR